MKLFIINEENNDEKIEININEDSMVEEIKYRLDEIPKGNGNYRKDYFRLIHKNIVLWDYDTIKYYKICENDEIWFGKVDKYLKEDDVIIYKFHCGLICGAEYLIVKKNDTISTIRSMIEGIHSDIINIWNADGQQMRNDQIVTEIDTNENYKLIIRCDDRKGNKINNTFDECCYLYDKLRVDRYLYYDQIRDDNKNESTRTILINLIDQIKGIISSNDAIDDRRNQNLSDFPSSFLNSTNLFGLDMTNRILDICNDYLKFVRNQYENDVVRIFDEYFKVAIRAALRDFYNIRKQINNKTKKLVSDIVIDSLDYFMKYLIDSSNDWQYWLRLWMDYYLLRSLSDSDLNEIFTNRINIFTIKMRKSGRATNFFILSNPETIIEGKQSIFARLKVDMKHLYCIKPGGDHKLNDEDKFEEGFIFEVVFR